MIHSRKTIGIFGVPQLEKMPPPFCFVEAFSLAATLSILPADFDRSCLSKRASSCIPALQVFAEKLWVDEIYALTGRDTVLIKIDINLYPETILKGAKFIDTFFFVLALLWKQKSDSLKETKQRSSKFIWDRILYRCSKFEPLPAIHGTCLLYQLISRVLSIKNIAGPSDHHIQDCNQVDGVENVEQWSTINLPSYLPFWLKNTDDCNRLGRDTWRNCRVPFSMAMFVSKIIRRVDPTQTRATRSILSFFLRF